MAKGQQRSNKEVRKPKQAKAQEVKAAPAAFSTTAKRLENPKGR
ncbi:MULTISPECIES: hypothetical protein [unclassified Phyllobacterium]|nr:MULTISPECIES: hypothetical protein [unclassified Phyllobacterium]SFJ40453.1 hypothetical protein SAMN04515648_3865 [Phyllobacterium sp. CL33Tsu]